MATTRKAKDLGPAGVLNDKQITLLRQDEMVIGGTTDDTFRHTASKTKKKKGFFQKLFG